MKNLAFVIEDTDDISNLFSRALVAEGFQVEIICNGAVASTRLEKESPTLIILDLHLPDVNGVTLLNQIRTEEHLKETIVFIVTADITLGDYHKDRVELLLEKPVTFSQMRAFVRPYKR